MERHPDRPHLILRIILGVRAHVISQRAGSLVAAINTGVKSCALPIRALDCVFFFQAEDGIRDSSVTGVQTCALPIWQARRELPDTRPVAKAAEAVGTHAVLLARARDETAAARAALDAAIAEVDAMTRRLRQAAAMRRMPTADGQVDAVARAAAEIENAATQLHAERAELRSQRQSLAEAVGQLYEQAAQFGAYARPDLRLLVAVTAVAPWPDPARWPDSARAGEDLAASLTTAGEPAPDPVEAVRGGLPPGVAEILDAFAGATHGGRQATQGPLKHTPARISHPLNAPIAPLPASHDH